jgi:hypothetical protein
MGMMQGVILHKTQGLILDLVGEGKGNCLRQRRAAHGRRGSFGQPFCGDIPFGLRTMGL